MAIKYVAQNHLGLFLKTNKSSNRSHPDYSSWGELGAADVFSNHADAEKAARKDGAHNYHVRKVGLELLNGGNA